MHPFLYFIINKQSKNSDKTFKDLVSELPKYTQNYEVLVTKDIAQLEKILLKLKKKIKSIDIIVMVGGDGSLNYLTSLSEKHQIHNPIGYIPAGAGNDFARSYKIPMNTKKALKHLFSVEEVRELSIIHTTEGEEEHFAVNSLGIGIDGMVIHLVNNNSFKKYFGPFSYMSSILSAFVKQKKFPVTLKVDQDVYQFDHSQLAIITNNPYFGGGIKIIPDAKGTDENLDILIADNITALELFKILIKLFVNQSHLTHPKLHTFSTKKGALYIDSKQYGQKDGEPINQDGYAYTFSTKKRKFWI